jgi:hypothetical protein
MPGVSLINVGKSVGASTDDFTACGSVVSLPPPHAVNTAADNSVKNFLMVISLVRKLLKKKLSKQVLEFGNLVLITFCKSL